MKGWRLVSDFCPLALAVTAYQIWLPRVRVTAALLLGRRLEIDAMESQDVDP